MKAPYKHSTLYAKHLFQIPKDDDIQIMML